MGLLYDNDEQFQEQPYFTKVNIVIIYYMDLNVVRHTISAYDYYPLLSRRR